MIVKLLTEHHLEFLSFTGGCRGSSESSHVKMPHCWKSHARAQLYIYLHGNIKGERQSVVGSGLPSGVCTKSTFTISAEMQNN